MVELIESGFTPGHRTLVHSHVTSSEAVIGYYSTSEVALTVSTLLRFKSLSECESELAAVQKNYDNGRSRPVAMFCADKNSYATYPGLVSIYGNPTGITAFSYYQYYSTRSDCIKALPTVIADVKSYGEEVFGAVCGYSYGYYMPYTFQPN